MNRLRVRIRKSEGVLVRLLGVVQRRGYDVVTLSARLDAGRGVYDVEVEFEPISSPATPTGRPPEVLARMVERLIDVESVELEAAAR